MIPDKTIDLVILSIKDFLDRNLIFKSSGNSHPAESCPQFLRSYFQPQWNSRAAEKIAIYESSGDAKIRAPELSIMAITFCEAGP